MNLQDVKGFLVNSKYMCLGTSDKSGNVWTSPMTYVTDDELTIYFHSALDSIHIENIKDNPYVSFSIYDSTLLLAEIDGIQGKAIVGQLEETEVEEIHSKFFEKHMPIEEVRKQFAPPVGVFLGDEFPQIRFFKLKILELYKKNMEMVLPMRREKIELFNLQ